MGRVHRIDLENDELHTKLGGGIPKSSIMLIEGDIGRGKSILSQRITYGAIKNEHKVSIISSEMTVTSFMNQMNSLKYDIESAFINKRLKFASIFPGIGSVTFKPNLIDDFMKSKELFDADIIIFDRLGELMLKKGLSLDDCYKLLETFNKMTTSGKTIIFCIDPNDIDDMFHRVLKGNAGVYIVMDQKELYGNVLNLLRVERYIGASGEVEKELPFKVRAGIGLVVELSS